MNTADVRLSASTRSLEDYYAENGYVVIRNLVPGSLIDLLLDVYHRDIVPSKDKFYRQNTNRYEPNVITRHGYVTNCFLDIHAFYKYESLRLAALDALFHPSLVEALEGVTSFTEHHLVQSMLFDANTETPPHQDWWYVDSVPNGQLLAAWIALESIHEDAGRFYVVPKSQLVNLHSVDGGNLSHSAWLARVRQYVDENREKLFAPALNKGDVLFWNSRTVHGSLPTKNEMFSRKSLTAHFLPSHLHLGNLFTKKDWITYQRHKGHLYFANQPEYSLKAMLASKVKRALYDHPSMLRLARKFQKRSISGV